MQAFSTSRNIDAKAICDLSMENYIEVSYQSNYIVVSACCQREIFLLFR